MTDGPYVEALLARKGRLTSQLRQIDDAVDTAHGRRAPLPGDMPWRLTSDGSQVQVDVDGWHWSEDAETLTRAALAECDQGLEDVALLPRPDLGIV